MQKFLLLSTVILFACGACIFNPATSPEKIKEYLGQVEDENTDIGILAAAASLASGSGSTDNSETTATKIVMFNAGQHAGGGLGGLTGADGICDAHTNKPTGTTAVALLSSSTRDLVALSGVPGSVPVVGPADDQISSSWALLWDGTIDMTLENAGVAPGGAKTLTGTQSSGIYKSNASCSDWTDTGDFNSPAWGSTDVLDSNWIDVQDGIGCGTSHYLICVAW